MTQTLIEKLEAAKVTTNEQLYDVIATNIKSGEKRFLDKGKTKENAEAIVKMAVYRRGVEEEFFSAVPSTKSESQS